MFLFHRIPGLEIFQIASPPLPPKQVVTPNKKSEDQRLSDPEIPVEKGFIWFRVLGCAMVAMREMSSIPTQRSAAFFWGWGGDGDAQMSVLDDHFTY